MHIDSRRALLIGLAAIVAILGVITAIVLTTDDDKAEPEAAATTTTSTSTSTSAPAVTEPAPEATDLEDGRQPAFLTALDVDGRTVEVDVIQFLTGEDARAAYEEETGDPGGPPNDYFIKNDNPRLRTLTVAPDVQVTVLGDDPTPVSVALSDLPERLAGTSAPEEGYLSSYPFWLTVENGVVVAIAEQYVP